jgi:hypothetical protein
MATEVNCSCLALLPNCLTVERCVRGHHAEHYPAERERCDPYVDVRERVQAGVGNERSQENSSTMDRGGKVLEPTEKPRQPAQRTVKTLEREPRPSTESSALGNVSAAARATPREAR